MATTWANQLDNCDRQGHPIEHAIHDQVGTAFELRVGLDLASQPGYASLLSYLPPDMYSTLLTSAGFASCDEEDAAQSTDPLRTTWQRRSTGVPAGAAHIGSLLACFAAAAMSELAHKHPDWPIERRRTLFDIQHDGGHTPDHIDPGGVATTALNELWMRYLEHGQAQLRALGNTVVLEPQPAPGYAIADLVIGHTLIDIKTHLEPGQQLPRFLDQVLTYALLDADDTLRLESIGVYLGWHGLLLTTPLDLVLRRASAGDTADIATLREALHEVMRADLDEARRRHEHKLTGSRGPIDSVRKS